jgi:hypothetical protein
MISYLNLPILMGIYSLFLGIFIYDNYYIIVKEEIIR